MFRRVRFECGVCAAGFVDWHDEEWERTPVFCVSCGEPIAAGTPVDSDPGEVPSEAVPLHAEPGSALGVLKGGGDGFPDTLRGLRVARPVSSTSDAPESSPGERQASEPTLQKAFAKANSTAPRAQGEPAPSRGARRRKLAPLAALVLGFAAGVPLTLLAEEPVSRVFYPTEHNAAALTRRLAEVATAIDDGDLEHARVLLDHCVSLASPADRRLTTLRARLVLGLILADRPREARRELVIVQQAPRALPSVAALQRVYDVAFASQPKAAAAAPVAPTPVAPTPVASPVVAPKPAFSKPELLAAARDRQRRSRLDDAQRLYEAILRTRPEDSEARCGLAEVQLLRGSVSDAAALFERVLRSNENYVPAWIALADIDWLRGRPERAACRYQLVVDRFPEGSYPPYISQRIARVTGSGVEPPSAQSGVSAPDVCGN